MTRRCAFAVASFAIIATATPTLSQTVRDSAGIVIVDNPAPDPARVALRMSAAPVARFTADTTRDSTAVAMQSIVRLSDGRFVANDARTSRLRYYDATGRLLKTAAGKGVGNGQVTLLQELYLARADSLAAWQTLSAPYVLFDPEGTYVRNPFSTAATLGRDPAANPSRLPSQLRGFLSDGSMIVDGIAPPTVPRVTWAPMGTSLDLRVPNLFFHVSADATRLLDTVGYFPGNDRAPSYTMSTGTTPTGGTVRNITTLSIPGLRRTSLVVDGDRVVIGEGSTYEPRVYSPAGVLTRIVRADVPQRPFTPADIDRVKAEAVSKLAGDARQSALDGLATAAFPRIYAAFGRVMVDAAHRIWVEPVPIDGVIGPWTVFDRDGKMLGTVQRPQVTVRVLWIGTDMIAVSGPPNPKWGTEIFLYKFGP